MEEVDNIIFHFLRQLDINIDDEVKQLSELPVEVIILSISKCLGTINPSLKLPQKLPQGVTHKIEVAAQLASMCKDMGYKNEVGYQTFLYYNEADLRQVFMFLIEHLPTEGKQCRPMVEPCDNKSVLYRNISRKIDEELNSIWIPHCCKPENRNKFGDFLHNIENRDQSIPIATNNNSDELIQKLITAKGITAPKNTSETHTVHEVINTDEDKHVSKKEVEINSTKSLKELREEVIIMRQKLNVLENERNNANVELTKIKKSCEVAESELKSIQDILSNINVNMDEGVEDILSKTRKIINTLHSKSEALTSSNLSLKSDIDKIKMDLPQSQRSDCKKTLVTLKETAKLLKVEYNGKEEMREQLKKDFANLSRGNKRSTFTKRILEIISNVDKQNVQIKTILEDTRELQKEINTLEGQLDRCFSVADETLFKDAKKDDQAKKAYKLLALLHSECNTIVSLVNETGTLSREIVDLEDHVKTEVAKKTEETLKKIQIDLSKMQEE